MSDNTALGLGWLIILSIWASPITISCGAVGLYLLHEIKTGKTKNPSKSEVFWAKFLVSIGVAAVVIILLSLIMLYGRG